jgi:nucleoside-diphosphate-sugar epimerase
VVLTSSCAAIYGDNADLDDDAPRRLRRGGLEQQLVASRTSPTPTRRRWPRKKAWELHDAQDRWRLVVMNPPGIFGPGVRVHGTSESFNIMTQLGDGTMAAGAPRLGLGLVDVRDVAEAHLRGAFLPDAEGRHVLAAHDTNLLDMAKVLAAKYPDYPLPKRAVPKLLLWLIGPFVNKAFTRKVVSRNIDLPWRGDSTKSREKLGMVYRSLETTLFDHFQQLIDEGLIGSKKKAA